VTPNGAGDGPVGPSPGYEGRMRARQAPHPGHSTATQEAAAVGVVAASGRGWFNGSNSCR
jgi:hypothetical protein